MDAATHLRSLQAVEIAIRRGSLKEAAAELAITPAAIGQRIKALEDFLGFDLIVRSRSGIRATRELETVLAHLAAGFRELSTVCRILDTQRVNEVRIAADSDWAELWLKPRLAEFRKANPNTTFRIDDVDAMPGHPGAADCEIWFGDAREDDKILFQDYLLPVSSRANTERITAAPELDRLEGFPLLHLDCYTGYGGAIGWPEWSAKYGYRHTAPERGIRYRKVMHALESVYANAGLIICGYALVKTEIDAGRLTLPFPVEKGERSRSAYRVRFFADSKRRSRNEPFRAWLLEQANETRHELERLIATRPE